MGNKVVLKKCWYGLCENGGGGGGGGGGVVGLQFQSYLGFYLS